MNKDALLKWISEQDGAISDQQVIAGRSGLEFDLGVAEGMIRVLMSLQQAWMNSLQIEREVLQYQLSELRCSDVDTLPISSVRALLESVFSPAAF